jgi:hypothetical protein
MRGQILDACPSVETVISENDLLQKKIFFGGLLCWEFVRKFPSNYSAIHRWTSIITLHSALTENKSDV